MKKSYFCSRRGKPSPMPRLPKTKMQAKEVYARFEEWYPQGSEYTNMTEVRAAVLQAADEVYFS